MASNEIKIGLKLLRDIDALYSDESRWTKHTVARREDGMPTDSRGPLAVSWCLVGAALRCGDSLITPWLVALDTLDMSAAKFNDAPETTFADVKALLARSIKKLEAQL